MRILKVPVGESPNPNSTEYPSDEPGPAVVICRGDTHNLWINHRTDETLGYPELTEGEAMVFGISARPGTVDNSYIGTVQSELNSRFGINASNTDVDTDAYDGDEPVPESLLKLIQSTENLAPDHDDFQIPWDVEQWNTGAGKEPKRTPIYEKDQQENR